MKTVTIHEAKTHLSRLIAEVEAGEEIVLARGQTPVAKLIAIVREAPQKRILGQFAGAFVTDESFDALLPDDMIDRIEAPLA
jgi:antitoxin (DNA-binding transcriptional repressor) of toxin-antitoxin stability system